MAGLTLSENGTLVLHQIGRVGVYWNGWPSIIRFTSSPTPISPRARDLAGARRRGRQRRRDRRPAPGEEPRPTGAFVELGLEPRGAAGAETGVPLLINDRAGHRPGLRRGRRPSRPGGHARARGPAHPRARTRRSASPSTRPKRPAGRSGKAPTMSGPARPIATTTKETPLAVLGPDGHRLIKRAIRIPVVAIGGIAAATPRTRRGRGPAASPSSRPSSAPRTRSARPKI